MEISHQNNIQSTLFAPEKHLIENGNHGTDVMINDQPIVNDENEDGAESNNSNSLNITI